MTTPTAPTCDKCARPLYLIRPGRRLCAACSPIKAIPSRGLRLLDPPATTAPREDAP